VGPTLLYCQGDYAQGVTLETSAARAKAQAPSAGAA